MAVVKVDRAVVRSFLAKITGEMNKSASTRNGALKALRGTMGYALDAGAVKVNPCFGLRLSTGSRDEKLFLTPAQVTDLAAKMPTKADALMVTFTAYTGLRAGRLVPFAAGTSAGARSRYTRTSSRTQRVSCIPGPRRTTRGVMWRCRAS
ncbi:MAG: hypothetical protein NVS3B21_36420 [Acidimicrobiales bacterium]